MLQQVDPLYGYSPKPSKSYLLVKEQYLEDAIKIFRGNKINKKIHLGASILNKDFKASYVMSLFDNWINQVKLLSKFAEPEPQSVD